MSIQQGSLKAIDILKSIQARQLGLVEKTSQNYVKSYTMHQTTIDLLALSVCWKRIRDDLSPGPRLNITSLLDENLFPHVSDKDIELANKIRDYYSKKLMMLALKSDRQQSQFRKDLATFVQSDGTTFKEEIIPLAFRLPEFYAYDTKLEEFVAISKQDFVLVENEYKFLGKLPRVRNKQKKFDYWFVDNKHRLHCVVIESNNKLLGFWDTHVHNLGVTKLLGRVVRKSKDEITYFEIIP